jgi:hypothetical protein
MEKKKTWVSVCARCAYKIVKLSRCDTSIDTRDDLLGDGDGVDMVRVKAIA